MQEQMGRLLLEAEIALRVLQCTIAIGRKCASHTRYEALKDNIVQRTQVQRADPKRAAGSRSIRVLNEVGLRPSRRRIAVVMQRAAPSSNLSSFVTCATPFRTFEMYDLLSPLYRTCGR